MKHSGGSAQTGPPTDWTLRQKDQDVAGEEGFSPELTSTRWHPGRLFWISSVVGPPNTHVELKLPLHFPSEWNKVEPRPRAFCLGGRPRGWCSVTYLLLNPHLWVTGMYYLGCILCRPRRNHPVSSGLDSWSLCIFYSVLNDLLFFFFLHYKYIFFFFRAVFSHHSGLE